MHTHTYTCTHSHTHIHSHMHTASHYTLSRASSAQHLQPLHNPDSSSSVSRSFQLSHLPSDRGQGRNAREVRQSVTHTHTHTHTHSQHTHTHTHTLTHNTHTHTHTHTHTLSVSCSDEEFVDLEKEFEQNELNSAVYLISVAMQISNFTVNYKVSFPSVLLRLYMYRGGGLLCC